MLQRLQDIVDASWEYLYGHGSLKPIHTRDIVEEFPGTFDGGFATVHKARLRIEGDTEKLVALKVLKFSVGGDNEKEQTRQIKYFARELRHAAKLSHQNIVKVEGFYIIESEKKPVIVSAWAGGGTMSQYTRANPNCNLRNIATGIATGLEYIHKNGIIHADLKGANILMSDDGVPMLSDFGQARAIQYTVSVFVTTNHLREKGTMNWIAPEIADYIDGDDNPNEIICTRQSDMWSYGMVIYELITGSIPYANDSNTPQFIHDARLQRIISRGHLPVKPIDFNRPKDWLWQHICIPCWKRLPGERLTARQAVATLTSSDDTVENSSLVESAAARRYTIGGREVLCTTIACSALLIYTITINHAIRWMENNVIHVPSFFK